MTKPAAGLRPLLARSMSEAQLQGFVLNAARDTGWLRIHYRPGQMRSGKWATPLQGDGGFPDVGLCKAPRFILAELKGYRSDGTLTPLEPEQYEWLAEAQGCPCLEAYLWTPEDWVSGEILRCLSEARQEK